MPARTTRDESRTPGQHAGCEQSPARLGQRGAAGRRPRETPRRRCSRTAVTIPTAAHTIATTGAAPGAERSSRIRAPAGDGRDEQHRASDGEQDDLARDPLQDDRADTSPDVAFRTAVPYRAVDVAEHTAGQRRVQEQRAVVVGDGAGRAAAAGRARGPPGTSARR